MFAVLPLVKKAVDSSSSAGGTTGAIGRIILRFFQFVMALTVAGLYGIDVNAAHKAGVPSDSRWIFAEVVAGLSALTVCLYGMPFLKTYKTFFWDAFVFLLWVVLVGIFGKLYIGADASRDHRITRMKHAVYVDSTNMVLWSISTALSTFVWMRRRRAGGESEGGRAKV